MEEQVISTLQQLYQMPQMAAMMEFCQGEIRVLLYLNMHRQETVYPSDLSSALYVSRQRITSVLNALRKKGYLTMEVDRKDRRRQRVLLTEAGASYVSAKQVRTEAYVCRLIESLGEDSTGQLLALLQKCIATLEPVRSE